MGREIRKVPADWEHPKREDGSFQPLFDECYENACEDWYDECIKNGGKVEGDGGTKYWYHEFEGNPPEKEYYRIRNWSDEEATHIQMYETVSEGTPVSPVFATKWELVNYLCEYGDFWDQKRRINKVTSIPCNPWTRKNAEYFVNTGFAVSGIISNDKIYVPSEHGELQDRTSYNICANTKNNESCSCCQENDGNIKLKILNFENCPKCGKKYE